MRSAQILALAGLAAAQSTTIVISDGISTTIVLPNWDVSGGSGAGASAGGPGVGSASVTLAVSAPDATTTLVVDKTQVVGTVTATSVPTSLGKHFSLRESARFSK